MSERAETVLRRAVALHRQGRRKEAIDAYRQYLAARPEATDAWYDLGLLLKAECKYDEALDAYEQALARGVRQPEEVHLNRAVIYSDHLRRDQEAERELKAALALNPDYVPALLNLGNLHEERGERQDALACYDRILAGARETNNPHQDLCFEALARTANLRPPSSQDDPVLRQLRNASAEAAVHGKVAQANLLFALGRAYDSLDQFDLAFDAFTRGNECLLQQTGRTYDRARAVRLTDALIKTFPPGSPEVLPASPETGVAPLFICGMFRSGSTLIEQVLASHPEVTAGGELDFLLRLAAGRLAPFPASMVTPDPERDAALSEEYRAHLLRLFPEGSAGKFITDKRPDNFLVIGLIKRLFPAAKIIHTCRHPLDNGLSIFMQILNHQVVGYANDLGDIGHYYGQYRRQMAHWKSLYPESIFDFDYDAFVREPMSTLERLFAFLSLEWDDRYLEFHNLGNTVKTASYWQVRRPLYAKASGRWRNYDQHLGPLRQALRDAGVTVD